MKFYIFPDFAAEIVLFCFVLLTIIKPKDNGANNKKLQYGAYLRYVSSGSLGKQESVVVVGVHLDEPDFYCRRSGS